MTENLKIKIIEALKRLIKKLKSGCCDNLTDSQLKDLEDGFQKILKVESEVYNGFNTNSGFNRFCHRLNFFNSFFSIQNGRDENKQ